jgi:hypothetical protein
VLITERNLQMKNSLASAGKSEVPRFDHSGMHGADGDFMNVGTFDFKEVDVTDRSRGKTKRFQPRVSLRLDTPYLSNLSFE